MKLWKSLPAFLAIAALAAATGASVSWAADPAAPQQEQDLPDLGSPATAAVSLEEEFQVEFTAEEFVGLNSLPAMERALAGRGIA